MPLFLVVSSVFVMSLSRHTYFLTTVIAAFTITLPITLQNFLSVHVLIWGTRSLYFQYYDKDVIRMLISLIFAVCYLLAASTIVTFSFKRLLLSVLLHLSCNKIDVSAAGVCL